MFMLVSMGGLLELDAAFEARVAECAERSGLQGVEWNQTNGSVDVAHRQETFVGGEHRVAGDLRRAAPCGRHGRGPKVVTRGDGPHADLDFLRFNGRSCV